ncbi:hypothetical protein SGGMMB4_05360 [Sodalis glossinidius str. 'morsitans']|uniref:Uncharacterized protein n=1 Tax=Sodalis glossinidius (strain morsitans) TaxID=343509 RepID=A0A193QML7_SODGM|nr:hypothetical protein SGGMMB4_04578 [Sodalis glossinidius str. 'morsitans']CRL46586.1 hypothetical protein SGGMMB4_05360 [Sodalis glossinidius str. 'morsitans']
MRHPCGSRKQPALLFNNLSDNLCGHSQDDIDIPKYQVLKSEQQIFI